MNESLLITQILEKNGRAYALMLPYGAPYADIYEVLAEFDKENRAKQASAIEAEEKKKLDQEMKDAVVEAS